LLQRILKKAGEKDLSEGFIPFKGGVISASWIERNPDGSAGTTIALANSEAVRSAIARHRSEPVKRRAHHYFRVRGPELR
jgi:hypothetical protein